MTRAERERHADRARTNLGDTSYARSVAKVMRCESRGTILPISRQPECGCAERSECLALRGPSHRPGEVSLKECLACVADLPDPYAHLGPPRE